MEDNDFKLPGQGGSYWKMGKGSEPYCGKQVLSKPGVLFAVSGNWQNPALDMTSDAKFLCFAYKGTAFYDGLDILVQFTTSHWQSWGAWVSLNVTLDDAKDDWKYTCVDLLEQFKADMPGWVEHWWNPNTAPMLKRVHINSDNNLRKDGFLDEVSFGSKANEITRVAPAHPDTAVRMEEITVNSTGDAAEILFNPYTCHEEADTFQLLGVAGGTIDEMSTSSTGFDLVQEQIAFLKTADVATWSVGGGKVVVERLAKQSPKMDGSFSLTLANQTVSGLQPYISAVDLQDVFENEFGLMGVEVSDHSSWDACWNYHISW